MLQTNDIHEMFRYFCYLPLCPVPSPHVLGLWHGVSAGILKTVPKYITAIVVKDFMDEHLPYGDSKDKVSFSPLDFLSLNA